MGQYYIFVNLDKKEWFSPSAFDDGMKILEFASSSSGSMMALAALLADGNDHGHEFALPYDGTQDDWMRFAMDYDMALAAGYNPRRRVPVPPFDIVGTWAGDRVVLPGEYVRAPTWLNKREQTRLRKVRLEEYVADQQEENKPVDLNYEPRLNLFAYAERFYRNIEQPLLAMLMATGRVRTAAHEMWFAAEIDELFTQRIMTRCQQYNRAHSLNHLRDLRWLSIGELDIAMRHMRTGPGRVTVFKRWLRKRALHPLIRDALACYTERDPDYKRLGKILEHHFPNHGWRGGIFDCPLPYVMEPAPTLQQLAALAPSKSHAERPYAAKPKRRDRRLRLIELEPRS